MENKKTTNLIEIIKESGPRLSRIKDEILPYIIRMLRPVGLHVQQNETATMYFVDSGAGDGSCMVDSSDVRRMLYYQVIHHTVMV